MSLNYNEVYALEKFWQSVRFGLPAFSKNEGFAVVAVLLLALSSVAHATGFGQSTSRKKSELPVPTGLLAVGRMAYHWTDSSRPEPLSMQKGAHRELMVYVWYPAAEPKSAGQTAPYMPDFPAIQKAVSEAALKSLLRPAYSAIQQSGYPRTHAIENAKMPASAAKYPVLVFSHGLGMVSSLYTAELADLASHGYVVAAIDHTYDTTFTVFPGGRFVTYAQEKWGTESKKPGGFINHVRERVEVWAADTRFVIDQLTRYDKTPSLGAPFAGHLDLQRIGAFGHSVGGLASARACQIDPRIRVCMDQDSDINGSPFVVNRPGKSLDQPFLFFIGPTSDLFSERKLHPTDEQLASWKLTRAEYHAIVQKQQKTQNEVLANVRGGSYRVILVDLPGFTHRSFSDLPLLATDDDATQVANHLHNFQIAQSYTRAFFDKYLKDQKNTLLAQQSSLDSRVRVDRFGPASE